MALRQYDLNLLPLLHALLRERNVTRAGRSVGLSQSAMSHALTRLRDVFADPLLVPSGRDMVLTRRAEKLLRLMEPAAGMLARLFEPELFDPAATDRHFRVLAVDYVSSLLLPAAMRRLMQQAPHAGLRIDWEPGDIAARLRGNGADIALLPRQAIAACDIETENLYADDLVVIAASDHPTIRGRIDAAQFVDAAGVMFRTRDAPFQPFADQQLAARGIALREVMTVADFLTLVLVVQDSHRIALVHRRFAEKLLPGIRIQLLEAPFETDRFFLDAFWHTSMTGDAGHQWLRRLLRETVGAQTVGAQTVGAQTVGAHRAAPLDTF